MSEAYRENEVGTHLSPQLPYVYVYVHHRSTPFNAVYSIIAIVSVTVQ